MTLKDMWVSQLATFLYQHNVAPVDQIAAIYGREWDDKDVYLREKLDLMLEGGHARFMGHLDDHRRARYCAAAWHRYGDEALRRYESMSAKDEPVFKQIEQSFFESEV